MGFLTCTHNLCFSWPGFPDVYNKLKIPLKCYDNLETIFEKIYKNRFESYVFYEYLNHQNEHPQNTGKIF